MPIKEHIMLLGVYKEITDKVDSRKKHYNAKWGK